ncbi:LysR family transcriptional regulator [Rhodocista pekingensis]|uniref:HTH-type transcriptional regulator CbbR n=1 Tax=Rhodocista pekingensis TaxID=201185 RepID=A0ABW2L183_9PROT
MHLTLQQLRLFEAVARHRSFTRAAEELHLTQPAVSIQIRRLEENAGAPLIEHLGKRFFLTPAGEAMYATACDVLTRLRSLDDELDELADTLRGPLRLAVATTAKYFTPHLLGRFVADHPAVVPRLVVTNRARLIQRLGENLDDFVIMGQVPDDLPLVAHPIIENRLVVVAHPQHACADRAGLLLPDLAGERWLMREPGSGTRTSFERELAGQGLSIEPYMELGSTEAIKQAVMAGLGLSVLPMHSIELELAAHRLVILDIAGFPLCRRWNAVHLQGKTLSRAARSFLQFLRETADAPFGTIPAALHPLPA